MTFLLLFLLAKGVRFEDLPKREGTKEITLAISFPKSEKQKLVTSNCKDLSNDLRITIKNNTDTVASFYNDNNFWGMYNLRFEITTEDSVYQLQRIGGNMESRQRFPTYSILLPGDSLAFEINLLSCKCDSMPVNANPAFYPLLVCFINIPERSLAKAKLKAIYHLRLEEHPELLENPPREFENFSGNRQRAANLTTTQIIKTFVADKLESKEYDIQLETEANQ